MKEAHWRVGQWKCHPPENLISILSESAKEAVVCTGSLSQDDHVLNRLPLLKYSWAEIYSLIFHYLLSLYFAYIRSLELDTITFILHFLVWGCLQIHAHCIANMQQIMSQFWYLSSSFCRHFVRIGNQIWSFCSQTVSSRGFQAHGLKWERSFCDHTSPGSLRLNRITTSAQMFVSLQDTLPLVNMAAWAPIKMNKQAVVEEVQVLSVHLSIKSKSTCSAEHGNWYMTLINWFWCMNVQVALDCCSWSRLSYFNYFI